MPGAWLADGTVQCGRITSDPTNGDLDHVRRRFKEADFEVRDTSVAKTVTAIGLSPRLRALGVLENKHIPEEYFNASVEQRLELVRGLLDQDGTIDHAPTHRILPEPRPQTHRRRLVRLLRSLGVIVHDAVPKPGRIPGRGRHVPSHAGPPAGHVHHRPARVLPATQEALLPRETRETANWLYVRSIRRVPDEPHRCLSIESPDHTYLVGGYIPTHNTRVLLHLAAQWGRLPNPDDRKSTIHRVLRPEAEFVRLRPVRQIHGRHARSSDSRSRGHPRPRAVHPMDHEGHDRADRRRDVEPDHGRPRRGPLPRPGP